MTGGTPDVDQHVETSPSGRYIRYSYVLGKGAYKTVYKAFDTEEALEVAWNKLHVDRLNEHDLEKVSNEVSLLRQVNHKNIIHFYDTWRGQDGNGNQTINFITEQMMSGTLKEYLRKAKAIKLKVIRRWCSNILEAIAYLHSQEPPIMHRDLKCDNIFINGHVGEVKIGDLGLSGVKEREKADSVIGTPEFMAPELYEESYTEKVDIYAFGMCLLEIVSMEYPYSECNNMAQIFKKVFNGEKPHAFDTLIDGDVKDVIAACLQREARRPSAMDLLKHPLFSEWEKDDGVKSNLSLVKGSVENTPADTSIEQSSRSMPIGTELIDWSVPLKRNVLVSMLEGEGVKDDQEISVVAAKENGGFYIGLEIPIRDAIKRVEFTFDPFEDSSQHIAHEMVSEFDLGTEQLSVIQQEIDLQVKIAKEQREAASRNATPQPAAKEAEASASLLNTSTITKSKSTSQKASIIPSSGTSRTERSSIPAPPSLTHSAHESISTTTSEQISRHQVPEEVEHQPEVARQQPVQPQMSEPVPNTVQDHSHHERPISPQLEGSQQISRFAEPVQPPQPASHLPAEQLVEQAIDHAVEAHAAVEVGREPQQQVQPFVHESIPDPLPPKDVVPSSQPVTPSPGQEVEANIAVRESQGSHAISMPVELQAVQHTEQHMESQVHQHVQHTLPQQTSLPDNALQPSGDGVGSKHVSAEVAENEIFQRQRALDVAHESTELRTSTSFGEGTTAPNDSDSARHNVMVQQSASVASMSGSFGASQAATEVQVHDVQEQKNMETHVEHQVLEQRHQVIPHTSSFVSSQAQSSTSMESPSGVLSPILPQESHQSLTQFSQNTTTTVLENAIPPATDDTHSAEAQEAAVLEEHICTEEVHIPVSPAVASSVLNDSSVVHHAQSAMLDSSADQSTFKGRDEVMHRANSFPQQQRTHPQSATSSATHRTEISIGHSSDTANRFPQSVSDEVLRAPSSVAIIEVPTKAPSTPITPAPSGRDFSDEHHQASPPTVRTMLQVAGVETMSQIHSVAVQGENHVFKSQSRTHEVGQERSNVNVNARTRPKSGSRPAIVVVSNDPSGSSGESSRQGSERPAKLLSEYGVPEKLPSTQLGVGDFANRRLGSPERPTSVTLSATHLGEYVGSEPASSQQPSPPATDQLRTSSWMSLHSDETSESTGFREHTISVASGRSLTAGNYDRQLYTLNLKLMDFCARGIYEEVTSKLSQGASATFADYDKRTPLHLAATEGHVSVCVLLIKHGADVNARDRWGQTPLTNANEGKFAEVKDLLVTHGAVDESARSVKVLSMELMQHTARGDLESVRQKIVAGALATFQDYDQRTPLHLACSEGHVEIAEVLLVNGASHSTRDRKGRSPVDDAVTNGHRSVVRVLRQYGASVPPHLFETEPDMMNQKGMDLLEHAARGRAEFVTQCLSEGANPKYGDYDDRTALHVACSEGRLDVVRILLQAGADIHAADRWNLTPLDEARKAGFTEILEELNRWNAKRAQRQAPSVSFDHSVVMNGHDSSLHVDGQHEGSHFDHLSHRIATSVSLGAIPNIGDLADEFVAEYPSSTARDPSSAGNSTTFSLPLTPFELTEDNSRVEGRSSEEILLQQTFNTRKRQLEEDHRRAFEQLLRKKSMESLRAPQVSPDPTNARSPTNPVPITTPQDTRRSIPARAVSDPADYGTVPNGSTRTEPSHGGEASEMSGSRRSETLPIARGAGTTYLINEDMNAGVGTEMSGENPTIRHLVDGLIDAAVSSNS